MADINWNDISEENRQFIQGYVAGITTRGNPALPATGPAAKRLALDPTLLGENTQAKGILTLAINELLKLANSANSATGSFGTRFDTIIGNEIVSSEDWEALQNIGENVTKALLKINNDIQEVEFGTLSIADIPSAGDPGQTFVLKCNFWVDTIGTESLPEAKFSIDNGTTWIGVDEHYQIEGLHAGPYTLMFIDITGYKHVANKEIELDASTTFDIVYETE